MQRILWDISICVNALAVFMGRNKARGPLLLWVSFYLLSAAFLRAADIWRFLPDYNCYGWIPQQVGIVALGSLAVRDMVRPYPSLVYGSFALAVATSMAISLLASLCLSQPPHYPNSYVEPLMQICGTASLALGCMTAVGYLALHAAECSVLAGFFLLYSILLFAGSDHLHFPGIGMAFSCLEIAAFSALSLIFTIQKR